ncbi:unnamed protein product [Caenorhabditis auriculariae]|uniref:BolA-like protein n=1 Tax=Caenorhabditis auriculariae TaxID=2777116 RepID=A0A8S1H9F9_9PELO|nr:unnamed protein product [Caenorhabditis auriculariae]
MSTIVEGPVAQRLRGKLQDTFSPKHLEVVCESHMHNVPKGSEKHFRVQIVSDKFEGLRVIERHRLVNQCLADDLQNGVHALRIDAIPVSQWKGQVSEPSPSCRGGFGL